LPLDPDPDSQYGSGSTKSLNPYPIRIHNPGLIYVKSRRREKEKNNFLIFVTER
jgi:hypothetical protein